MNEAPTAALCRFWSNHAKTCEINAAASANQGDRNVLERNLWKTVGGGERHSLRALHGRSQTQKRRTTNPERRNAGSGFAVKVNRMDRRQQSCRPRNRPYRLRPCVDQSAKARSYRRGTVMLICIFVSGLVSLMVLGILNSLSVQADTMSAIEQHEQATYVADARIRCRTITQGNVRRFRPARSQHC